MIENEKWPEAERGQAIVLLVFGMIVLLGMAGLAIDGGNVYTQRRRGQNAVDNAALAYAAALNKGTSSGAAQATSLLQANGYVNGQNGASIAINNPPSAPGYDASYVEVVLTKTVPTAFIHFVYNGPAAFTVKAMAHGQAGATALPNFAIVTLGNCLNGGGPTLYHLNTNGGGVQTYGGGILLNTPENAGNRCAIRPSSQVPINTPGPQYPIVSVGSYNYQGSAGLSPLPVVTGYNGGVPLGDPLASVAEPTCTANGSGNGTSGSPYRPGNYGGPGEPPVPGGGAWASGIFCITGSITLSGSSSTIRAQQGSVIVMKTGSISLSNGANLLIKAPTASNCLGSTTSTSDSCAYIGLAFWSSRTNCGTVISTASTDTQMYIVGTVYAPCGTVLGNGTVGDQNYPYAVDGQLIAARVSNNGGNGNFMVRYNPSVSFQFPPTIQLVK